MSPTLSPGARLGRYEIKIQLGAGGMGEVYLAEDCIDVYGQTCKRSEAAAVVEEFKERYAKRKANGHDIARVYVGLGEYE